MLSEEEVGRLFGVLLAELRSLSLTNARAAVAAAGITGVNAPKQYWDPFLAGVEQAFYRLEPGARLTALRILADHFSDSERVRELFTQHGYEYVDGAFVPVALLDRREALFLPSSPASELAKAMKRLVGGDETGAITAACGAVDTLMQELYAAHSIGDPAHVAFAAKVNTAAKHLGVFDDMKAELMAIGMAEADAEAIVSEAKNATNHAAQMLQILRRTMGDVHGSKPALRRAAYDAIKWASAISGLFDNR
ncbi:hypothetical protein [Oceanibaculum pacificum]|jgi:hypothetical protein|uniref:Uncharacterized protein n=1 Tax=Oceanibaculum pacificum TaxID=580166 RepID=A0A154W151_9PROT|nr:hypothetical protein [Oceanibaculum pacificum]KZD07352.1 hypothetical protein AUP43_02190 [Oceanibaculum pacificum]